MRGSPWGLEKSSDGSEGPSVVREVLGPGWGPSNLSAGPVGHAQTRRPWLPSSLLSLCSHGTCRVSFARMGLYWGLSGSNSGGGVWD